jgi:hypothetical protein
MRHVLFTVSLSALTVGWNSAPTASASAPCTHTSLTKIYIRQYESLPPTILDPLILAGEYNINPGGSSLLTIAIKDSKTTSTTIRTARNEYDIPIAANTTYQLESDVTLEK